MKHPDWDKLSDKELVDALTPILRSIINACYYRVLGQASIQVPIEVIERYIDISTHGKTPFYGEKKEVVTPTPMVWKKYVRILLWKDCDVSNGKGLTTDIWVWGFTSEGFKRLRKFMTKERNTVFTRKYWWKCYVIRGTIENALGLKPNALRLRELNPFVK